MPLCPRLHRDGSTHLRGASGGMGCRERDGHRRSRRVGTRFAAVLSRPFGLGGARHRVGGKGPVEHVFSGAYLREKVVEAGGFDTELTANQDFELDYQLRTLGGTIWLEPSLRSDWHAKESPGALVRQMARYGYDKAGTLASSSFGEGHVNSPRRSWWHFSPPRLQLEPSGASRVGRLLHRCIRPWRGGRPAGRRVTWRAAATVARAHRLGRRPPRRPRDTLEHGGQRFRTEFRTVYPFVRRAATDSSG